jgi:hypothetical protein
MRVDFPDGRWSDIYAVGEMPRRVTVRMQDLLAATPEEQNGYQALREMNRLRDTLMAMVIKSWDYDTPLTGELGDRSPQLVYDLPQDSYDKLKAETEDHWVKAGFTRASATEGEPPTAEPESPEKTTSSA